MRKSSVMKKQPWLIKPASLETPKLKSEENYISFMYYSRSYQIYISIQILVHVFKAMANSFWKQIRDVNIISSTSLKRWGNFMHVHLGCFIFSPAGLQSQHLLNLSGLWCVSRINKPLRFWHGEEQFPIVWPGNLSQFPGQYLQS